MNKRYQISYYLRIVLEIVIYLIFFGYIIYSIINAKDNSNRLFNIIIGLVVGGFGILYEYLRINYDAATKRLIVDNKPNETIKMLERVNKLDIFKAYKTGSQMMKMLALNDLREFDELKDYINDLNKQGINDYDVEIVSKYSEMILYGEKGLKGKSNTAFKQLIELRDKRNKKGRRNKGAFYFNWEVVNGQHKNYDGDYHGGYKYLSNIEEANMNKRELMNYLIAKYQAAKHINKADEAKEIKDRLIKLVDNNQKMKAFIETI